MDFPRLSLPPRKVVQVPEEMQGPRWIREGRRKVEVHIPPVVRQPLVLNHGVGTDSTAMLVLLVEQFKAGDTDARPDRIIFADVLSEKMNTYLFIDPLRQYLRRNKFPDLIIVSKSSRGLIDRSLHESCERLKTMPSLAYGGKSCSIKWKTVEMDFVHARWHMAQHAWAVGMPVIKLIGYDASPADMRRSKNAGDAKYSFAYPLRDAGLQRPQLMEIIAAAGLPQPGKSACFMCPATKLHEFPGLYAKEPEKLARALRIEAAAMLQSARKGKKMTTKGLGRRWSWREHLAEKMPEELDVLRRTYGIGDEDWQAYQTIITTRKEIEADGQELEEVDHETCDDTEEAEGSEADARHAGVG